MVSLKKALVGVSVVLIACCVKAQTPSIYELQTLREVLRFRHLPTYGFTTKELERPITSWSVTESEPFVCAYFDDDGSGMLHEPLHVLRYAGGQLNLQRLDIRSETDEIAHAGFLLKPSSECMGSVLGILEMDKEIFIKTHINPSATCTLVLDTDLKLKENFFGWILEMAGPYAIVEMNQIHFAAVHPAELAIFDSERLDWSQIYPIKRDPARDAFSKELTTRAPDKKWCLENNNPCDPSNFDVDIRGINVSPDATSFTFDAVFSAHGFGEKAEKAVSSVTTRYLCQLHSERWSCQLKEG